MKVLFIQYPKCTTCIKAKKWLQENNVDFEDRHIVENNPKKEELKAWFEKSGLPINKFFNTSGKLYKEMNLKDKVKTSSEEELLEILSSNGMIVKRPIVVGEDFVLVGFKEEQWEEKLK
ncbi:arsenate reductase family protein [Clostridium malenominatum]|uniref:Arsenate reductase family protein n=1 Tax=Clostridium malenominatum TaxID=1539 RepID=A0ABN1ISP3_9CLOT